MLTCSCICLPVMLANSVHAARVKASSYVYMHVFSMHVCICVYIYICLYLFIYLIYVFISVYIYIYVSVYIYICICGWQYVTMSYWQLLIYGPYLNSKGMQQHCPKLLQRAPKATVWHTFFFCPGTVEPLPQPSSRSYRPLARAPRSSRHFLWGLGQPPAPLKSPMAPHGQQGPNYKSLKYPLASVLRVAIMVWGMYCF